MRFGQGDLLPIGQDIYDANGNLEAEVELKIPNGIQVEKAE